MDVPYRIVEALLQILPLIGLEILLIFVDVARNYIEIESLCRLRLAIHEQRKGLRWRVAQPFFNGQTIALGFGNLLALFVEKQLKVEAFRRHTVQRATNLAR